MHILLLGNSLTSANDMPSTLAHLTGGEVVAHTRGGARLAEQLNPATKMGSATQEALRSERWDFVVMQESSNGPVLHREAFLRSAAALCEQARSHGAMPILFATWAYRPNSAKLARMDMDFETMARALGSAYREAGRLGKAPVADVGQRFLESCGATELYAADGIHPSQLGSRLAAETIATTMGAV